MDAPYHLIRLDGMLDISRYPEFRAAFTGLEPGVPTLVDLTGALTVDSVFLSELMLFRRRHRNRVAVLIPPAGSVAQAFAAASLGTKVNVFRDLSEAVEWLGLATPSGGEPEPA